MNAAPMTGWRTGVVLAGLLVAVRLVWQPPMAVCVQMTATQCVTVAAVVVVGVGLAAAVVRAGWLAGSADRAVAGLPRVSVPPPLARALARTGVSGAHCVDGTDAVAFCAGVLHPRVYVTAGLIAALGPEALDAVLVHEATHASRRDPVRRLAHRAFADVFFYLPVITCWSRRQIERAELHADQVAITHAGRGALAQALLATGCSSTTSAPGVGFDGALDARIAQLLGDDPPRRPLSPWHWLLSLAGLIAAVSLMMCLGQAAVAAL